jgi:hypothetical protein
LNDERLEFNIGNLWHCEDVRVPTGENAYLFLDTRYKKARLEAHIHDGTMVLIAVGIKASGKRRVLGWAAATNEVEINWQRIMDKSACPQVSWRQDHRSRRSCSTQDSLLGGIALGSQAALTVPSATERRPVRHLKDAKNRHRPSVHDLQGTGQNGSRSALAVGTGS